VLARVCVSSPVCTHARPCVGSGAKMCKIGKPEWHSGQPLKHPDDCDRTPPQDTCLQQDYAQHRATMPACREHDAQQACNVRNTCMGVVAAQAAKQLAQPQRITAVMHCTGSTCSQSKRAWHCWFAHCTGSTYAASCGPAQHLKLHTQGSRAQAPGPNCINTSSTQAGQVLGCVVCCEMNRYNRRNM
jgi:hypothetical protein